MLTYFAVNDSKIASTIGNRSFSNRSLTPIIDRRDRKLIGKGSKMRIVKDFAKFPQPTLNIEKGITNLINKDERGKSEDLINYSESCENTIKTKRTRSFSADDNSHLNVSIIIENNEELKKNNIEEKTDQKHELIIDSVNFEVLNQNTTNHNLLLNSESLIVVDNDTVIHSGIPFLPCINTLKNKSITNESHDDYIISNHINNESTTRENNENTNNNKNNLISVFNNDDKNHINEDDDISSFVNHVETLLVGSVALSSHKNILKSEITANNEGNEISYIDDCDDAIIADFDNEYKQLTLSSINESICINENSSDNMNNMSVVCNNDEDENYMKEMKNENNDLSNCNEIEVEGRMEESKQNNYNDNDHNMNIQVDNIIQNEICPSPIGKKSIITSMPEPSRTLHENYKKQIFNSHSRSNPNLTLNSNSDSNLILNNINLNKKGDVIPLHLHQDDHNNIELNTVVDCPLVEGLGHEDAFKPRRSSIQVT